MAGDEASCGLILYVMAQVTIVPGLGITLESRRRCGLLSQQRFLEQSTLRSVFINEVCGLPYAVFSHCIPELNSGCKIDGWF